GAAVEVVLHRLGAQAAGPGKGREGVRRRPGRHADHAVPGDRRDGHSKQLDAEGRAGVQAGGEQERHAEGGHAGEVDYSGEVTWHVVTAETPLRSVAVTVIVAVPVWFCPYVSVSWLLLIAGMTSAGFELVAVNVS